MDGEISIGREQLYTFMEENAKEIGGLQREIIKQRAEFTEYRRRVGESLADGIFWMQDLIAQCNLSPGDERRALDAVAGMKEAMDL